jgi:ubiquitin carboxyl-terminal hydrolase 5/13
LDTRCRNHLNHFAEPIHPPTPLSHHSQAGAAILLILFIPLPLFTHHSQAGADIFSYANDENDMVLDPLLAEHLSHWGIDVMKQEKTEKTMAELQVSLNMEYDWSKITEGKETLVPLTGPGFVGIANLGNSCYLNSVVQSLFATPEVRARYFDVADRIFKTAPENPANDFASQMAKVGAGLLGGRYALKEGDDGEGVASPQDVCVRPLAFRTLVGQGHSEFSTGRQQDAAEYLEHLLDFMSRAEHGAAADRLGGEQGITTANYFNATVEERYECGESNQVRYTSSKMPVIGLNIPMDEAANKPEVEAYGARLVANFCAGVFAARGCTYPLPLLLARNQHMW